eukprot:SAG31_NODE_798_length_12027_cov_8.190057_4_plen_86_part_00
MPFKAEVYVAMDTRPSGPAATALVVAGAEACGAAVQNFGVATTPQLHYMVMQRNAAVSDTRALRHYAPPMQKHLNRQQLCRRVVP